MAIQLESWKLCYPSGKQPVCTITEQSKAVYAEMPTDIREVIRQYFSYFNDFIAARDYQTDTFVKEVYYASTQDRSSFVPLKEMEARIYEINRTKLRLDNYELDEYLALSPHVSMIGVTRQFSNDSKNRVLYFLEKDSATNDWKFHHIARSIRGKVIEKFHVNQQIAYVISSEEGVMLFLTAKDSGLTNFQSSDQIHVEGYLEIHDSMQSEWYYRIFRMNHVH